MLRAAERHLAEKAYKQVHEACIEVLTRDPKSAKAFLLLAHLTADHQNYAKAIELCDRALAVEMRADALALKARCLLALNRREDAVAAADQAATLPLEEGHTIDTIGVVYSRAGLHDRALPFYDRALELSPENGAFHYNRGAALQFLGEFEESAAAYRRAARWAPDDYRSLPAAVMLESGEAREEDISTLERLMAEAEARDDVEACLHIGHALAKVAEGRKDPSAALSWLERAKVRKRNSVHHDKDEVRSLFAAAHEALEAVSVVEAPAEGPIFIVGMPRTGTTLVDRILSSHSAVSSAGELSDFGLHLKRSVGTSSPLVLDAETLRTGIDATLPDIGAAYVRGVENSLGLKGRFTDKMPFNFFYVPAILAAIPGARVICLRRHPADTVLSNYRQLFATAFSYYSYAYDLVWTADYVSHFNAFVEAMERALPASRFRVMDYEALVQDFEPQVRRLLEGAGLDFEEGCLSFHENAAPVATASATQVRQPLYASALARWKRYRPGLDPAIEELVRRGVMDDV